jgi:L,D-transpeptidase ErfK/SrfK
VSHKLFNRACLLLPLAVAMSGCTTFSGFADGQRASEPEPTLPLIEQDKLEPISRNYFELQSGDQTVVGEPQIVFTNETDTFSDLAREYGLGYDDVVAANPGVDPWLPGEGTPIVLPTQYVLPDAPKRGIVLNIASKRLFYFPEPADGEVQVVMTYPIGIGRVGWETPLGEASVISKARDPHWYVPTSVRKEHAELGNPLPAVVPPGPDNPLGRFVLKLDMPGYLIHGTNQPYGVGMRVSHGCVRLYPENIEVLYSLVERGEGVLIVNQPYLMGWLDGELYFEGHTPLEDDAVTPDEHLASLLEKIETPLDDDGLATLRGHIKSIAADGSGVPVRALRNDVHEVLERARLVRNTVEPDPDVPTLAEVREILDTPIEELESEIDAESDAGQAVDE